MIGNNKKIKAIELPVESRSTPDVGKFNCQGVAMTTITMAEISSIEFYPSASLWRISGLGEN